MNSDQRENARRGRSQAGFTLMELMLTIGLAAVLFGLAIPSFRGIIANNQLVTQTNDLITAVTLARSEAIKRNSTVTFCRVEAADDTDCAGEAGEWTFWIIRNPAGDVIRAGDVATYGGTLTVTSTLENDEMTFSPDGLARTGTPAALLNDGNTLEICSSRVTNENIRTLSPGASSRMSTARSQGECS